MTCKWGHSHRQFTRLWPQQFEAMAAGHEKLHTDPKKAGRAEAALAQMIER